MTAPAVGAITNVTALVGEQFEPRVVDIRIGPDGRIARVEPAGQEPIVIEGEVIDGSNLLAFPGLVDTHDHFRHLAAGLPIGEGLKLDDFLRAMWSTQGSMVAEDYRLGALVGSLQRLKNGMTTVVDHCYPYHAPSLDEATLAGLEASGARWVYARGVMTRPYPPVCEDWVEAERNIRGLVEGGRVAPERLFVAPVSIRQAHPDDFARARALADDLGCGVYTHVSETVPEQDIWRREAGAGPIEALDRLGFLTPRTVLIHCLVLDDDDIELIARRGCHVIHCPTNHMKMAKGFTRVPDLLAAGVNVAIGLDMMTDMLVEMRTELGMHAVHRGDPNAVSKLQALEMATWRGAAALGIGDRVGVIAPGFAADLVLLERSILLEPLNDPAYALLYNASSGLIRHVLVDGKQVIRDRQSTLVDEEALRFEFERAVGAYLERIGFGPRPGSDRAAVARGG